jgi:hypothetical protein
MSLLQKQFHERLQAFLVLWAQQMLEELEVRTSVQVHYNIKNLDRIATIIEEYMMLEQLLNFYPLEDMV